MTFGLNKLMAAALVTLLAISLTTPLTAGCGNCHADDNHKWSFELGADVTTEYWFRGISQGDNNTQGFISQPYMDATVQLSETVSANVGIWNSFTSSGSGGASGWHEADLYAGLVFSLPNDLSMAVTYVSLYGPEGGSEVAQEIDLLFSLDDSQDGLLSSLGLPFSLNPYALFAFEISGGSDLGTNEGGYLELGVEPSVVIVESEDAPITLSVPLTAGFNLYDYYESPGSEDTFNGGYFAAGLVLSTPLPIASNLGAWEMSIGVHLLLLNDDAKDISALNGTGNEREQIIGTFGISMSY